MNGSLFSLVYYITKFRHLIFRADHTCFRRLGLLIQFLYEVSVLVLSWFGVGSLYLSLMIIFTLAAHSVLEKGEEVLWAFSLAYGFLSVLQVRQRWVLGAGCWVRCGAMCCACDRACTRK